MSEATEQAILRIFEEKMHEISCANRNLRKWMYSLIGIFSIGLLSAMYWAGTMSQKVESMTSSVKEIKVQVDRMESQYSDIVWFMVSEFKYKPTVRGEIQEDNKR
jgi:hypothetical protein